MPADVAAATDVLVTKAQGLFVYCREVVDSLETGKLVRCVCVRACVPVCLCVCVHECMLTTVCLCVLPLSQREPQSISDPSSFPSGIDSLFMQSMERQYPSVEGYRRVMKRVIEVLAASFEQLDVDTVCEVLDLFGDDRKELEMSSIIAVQAGYLVVSVSVCLRLCVREQRCVCLSVCVPVSVMQPFHSSFLSEWVVDELKAGAYSADIENGHRYAARAGAVAIGTVKLRCVCVCVFRCLCACVRVCSALAKWAANSVSALPADGSYPRYVLKHGLEHAMRCNLKGPRSLLESNADFLKQRRLIDMEDSGASGFYYGTLERVPTEAKLSGKPPGTFLIRYSTNAKTYCVSFVTEAGAFAHCLLYGDVSAPDGRKGYCIFSQYRPQDKASVLYSSLADFVIDYQDKGILRDWVRNTDDAAAARTGK